MSVYFIALPFQTRRKINPIDQIWKWHERSQADKTGHLRTCLTLMRLNWYSSWTLLGVFTITSQTLRAAVTNPVKSLRYE